MIPLCTALLSLVALVFSTSLEVGFTLPKVLILRALTALILLVWLARARKGQTRPLPQSIVVLALALAAWWTFTTIVAVDPWTALHGEHGRYNGLLNQLLMVGLFLSVASAGLRFADIEKLARAVVLALVPAALYAVVQFAGWDPLKWPGERSASTIGNPVILAAVLGMGMPLALVFALRSPRSSGRWMWGAALVALLMGSYTTLSRGPLLAGVFAILVIGGLAVWESGRRLKSWTVIAAAVAAVIVVAVGYRQVTHVRQGLTDAGPLETTRTLQDRFNTYQAALAMVRERPFTGVGLENFSVVYPRFHTTASEQLTPDVIPTMVHDGYLQQAATTGIPGLLCYLALVGVAGVLLVRAIPRFDDHARRWLGIGLAASVGVYLIQDLSGWFEISLSMFFWFVLGLSVALAQTGNARAAFSTMAGRVSMAVVGIGALIVIGLAVESAVVTRTDYLMRSARTMDQRSNWSAVDERLTAALALVRRDATYMDEAGVRYGEHYVATGDAQAEQRAIALLDEAMRLAPFKHYIALHRLALDGARLARNEPPTPGIEGLITELKARDANNGSVYEGVARFRLAQGRRDEALQAVGFARVLRPTEGKYEVLEGDIRRALGDRVGAVVAYRTAMTHFYEGVPGWQAASQRLIVTLLDSELPGPALAEAKQLVAKAPDQALGHTLLGYCFLRLKDVANSRSAFELALRINPADQDAKRGLIQANALK